MTALREQAAQYCSAMAAWWSGAGADPIGSFPIGAELAWRAYLMARWDWTDPSGVEWQDLIWAEAEALIRTGWAP